VKQITTTSKFGYYEQFIVHTEDIVKTNHVIVSSKLAENIDFFLKLSNIFGIITKHYALACKLLSLSRPSTRVAFRFSSRSNANLSVGPFANDKVAMKKVGRSTLSMFLRRRRRFRCNSWRRIGGLDILWGRSPRGTSLSILWTRRGEVLARGGHRRGSIR
jgi:hypothetical protein